MYQVLLLLAEYSKFDKMNVNNFYQKSYINNLILFIHQ
jgi:hypothetical protein